MSEIREPNPDLVDAFWTVAIDRARLNPTEAYTGFQDLAALQPPTFAFGDTKESADHLANLVVSGAKRATSSYGPSYAAAGEDFPAVGGWAIVVDGDGRPRALISTERVEFIPFSRVGAEVSDAEGEGSLEQWVSEHEAFFTREIESLGGTFDRDADIVVEYFSVAYAPDVGEQWTTDDTEPTMSGR